MSDNTDLRRSRRKIRDQSIALVLVGIALLMPPVVGVCLVDGSIAGVPIPLFYIFVVWAVLIAGAAALARALRDSESSEESSELPDSAV